MKDTHATVIIDLTRSEDEILKSIEKSARNGITKAQREGLKVIQTGICHDAYGMYKQTMIDGGSEPKTIEELKEETVVYFECLKDGLVIAEASLKIEDGRITLATNSSKKEYQKLQPNNLLYWECIKWAKAKGYKLLDLGGWQINAQDNSHLQGINKFKEKWGKIVYYERDYPIFRAIGRKIIKRSPFIFSVINKLKGRK